MNDERGEEDRYIAHGYKDRDDYLSSLAEEWDIDREMVYLFAEMLGDSEDFDGLVNELEDFASL